MNTPQDIKNIYHEPKHYSFLLVPNFSLIPYASAIETLRMANLLNQQKLFTWGTLSLDGNPVTASCGLEVTPNYSTKDQTMLSTVFVCGGINIKQAWTPALGDWLKRLNKKNTALGALSTATYMLAKAGLLDGYRCTLHWDNLASTREEFPSLLLTDCIYEIDRDRYTCAGGTTAIDMMLHLIALEHGIDLAAKISDNMLLERIRGMNDRQRIPLRHTIGTSQPKLTEAAILMENNMEEPLSSDELASYVDLSRRQLERLFKSHLNCSPMQYYLDLRLKNARRLLKQTEKSILDISITCGFTSAAHFSNCYRKRFGLTPRSDRSLTPGFGNND